ncbi:hypothetical protein [Sagittula salina]|uniref:Uncharacterized protein n=1 Tax=Sagittula salina TaxID=2820268 RepID=A0A940MRI8_9RHOB|nr:hypothetical protein [Sagittula salina]MBP0484618.1 hypothetical protein [Sagittula salina]
MTAPGQDTEAALAGRPSRRARPVPLLPEEQDRQGFRRRRLVDAACAMPFFGMLLWWLPLLWRGTDAGGEGITTAQALIYIFAVWLALPLATGLLIRAIRRASAPDRPEVRP